MRRMRSTNAHPNLAVNQAYATAWKEAAARNLIRQYDTRAELLAACERLGVSSADVCQKVRDNEFPEPPGMVYQLAVIPEGRGFEHNCWSLFCLEVLNGPEDKGEWVLGVHYALSAEMYAPFLESWEAGIAALPCNDPRRNS